MFTKLISSIKAFIAKYPLMPAIVLFILGLLVFSIVAINQLNLGNSQGNSDKATPTPSESSEDLISDNSIDQQVKSETPTPTTKITTTPTAKVVSTSTPTPQTNNPTSTPTSAPTSTPTPTPSPSPTPIPEGTCSIVADPSSGPSPLTVNFAYGASYGNADNWVTAVQWDFDGDGDWDTDMAFEEINKRPVHIYYTGNYTVKMHLTLKSGYVTPVCSIEINAQ